MDTIKLKIKNCKTKIIAHRGFACCNLENTLDAFKFANNSQAFGVECDIQPSLDRKLFVFHDASFKRLTNRNGILRLMLSSGVKNIKLINNKKQYNIPTFIEYLKTVKDKIKVIELKGWFDTLLLRQVIKQVNTFSNIKNCVFISFNLSNLIRLKKLDNKIKAQFLTETFNNSILNNLINYKLDLNISLQEITEQIVKICHKNKIKVNVWTVDDKEKLLQLLDFGVDFITTNKFEIIS